MTIFNEPPTVVLHPNRWAPGSVLSTHRVPSPLSCRISQAIREAERKSASHAISRSYELGGRSRPWAVGSKA